MNDVADTARESYGALIHAAGQRESLHGVTKGEVEARVTEGQRTPSSVMTEGTLAAELPAGRARHLEEHPETNRQPGAELGAGHLDLGHLGDRLVGQEAGASFHLMSE